ncbi:glycoside hydrolase family 16 protein [Parabacteroides distasonis]|nr:glycoside hydrolase family 16 protein [Parabacteroides distasonis]
MGNGNWGWGNGEIEYYTNRTDNVRVAGGSLQIIAKKENYGGQKYTSGRIISKGKKYFKYGKMEARIKVENGNQDGVWPAYWMMGENMGKMDEGVRVGWPYCGEIDIMEHANSKELELVGHIVGKLTLWNMPIPTIM